MFRLTMSIAIKPPYDAELLEALEQIPPDPVPNEEWLKAEREEDEAVITPQAVLKDPAISHREVTIDGPGGNIILFSLTMTEHVGQQEAWYPLHSWRLHDNGLSTIGYRYVF